MGNRSVERWRNGRRQLKENWLSGSCSWTWGSSWILSKSWQARRNDDCSRSFNIAIWRGSRCGGGRFWASLGSRLTGCPDAWFTHREPGMVGAAWWSRNDWWTDCRWSSWSLQPCKVLIKQRHLKSCLLQLYVSRGLSGRRLYVRQLPVIGWKWYRPPQEGGNLAGSILQQDGVKHVVDYLWQLLKPTNGH